MAAARLPTANARQVIRALKRAGFDVYRVAGGHYILTISGDHTRTVTVPFHSSRDLKPGTLRAIIRQAGLSVEEFVALL